MILFNQQGGFLPGYVRSPVGEMPRWVLKRFMSCTLHLLKMAVRISCNWRNGLQLACRHKTFLFNLTSAYPCFSLTLVKRCKKRVGSKDSIPIHSTIILISREACLLHLIPQDLEGQNAFTPSNQATQSLVNLDSDKKTWAQRLPRNPKPDALGAWSTISIYFDFVVGFYCG